MFVVLHPHRKEGLHNPLSLKALPVSVTPIFTAWITYFWSSLLPLLWASRSEVIGASKSKSRAWTFVNCLSAVMVVGEISYFSIGSSCAGLVAGTFGRGYFL